MAECRIRVDGLDCATESAAIREALADVPGVHGMEFDLFEGHVRVRYDERAVQPEALRSRIQSRTNMRAQLALPVLGPTAAESERDDQPRDGARTWWLVGTSGACLALGFLGHWLDWGMTSRVLLLVVVAVAGAELAPQAWRSVLRLRLDIHVLMTLAIAGALVLGQWDEGATVAFLFLLSEALEKLSLARARRAVRALLTVAPETAELLDAGTARVVPARQVEPGQRVLVRPGARVPVDGRIAAGSSSIDQKMITGESVPVFRSAGDVVYAGTINGEGVLEVEATQRLSESLVTRVAERVRAAMRGRTPAEKTVDRFAAIYTPLVVALAVAMMSAPLFFRSGTDARWWVHQGLVLLVIACPCALVIATPVAVVSALASAARRGILIKGGEYLEMVGRLRVLAFDKTGTLTRGEPEVVEVVSHGGSQDEELMRIAGALGDRGGHVLGQAIARHARSLDIEIPTAREYRAFPGLGAAALVGASECHMGSHRFLDESGLCRPDFHASLGRAEQEAGTPVAVTRVGEPLGWFRLADRPRPEAARAVSELRRLGVEPVMLTGDNTATAEAVSRELGISDRRAGLLPDDKALAVAELDERRGATGMVGDGVNDTPALAAARVSIAMGGAGSAAALEVADVVLMGDDLTALPWLVRHSRRTLATIRLNIGIAVGTKLVFMLLAVLGLANLWMAIAADLGVSLLVVAIALRLLRAK